MNTEQVAREEKKVFASRWGYYPCDYDTYIRLKKLAEHVRRALHMSHAWKRWARKLPHNRVARQRLRNDKGQCVGYRVIGLIPEPQIDPVFPDVTTTPDWKQWRTGKMPKIIVGDDGVLADYQRARFPKATPEAVEPLQISLKRIADLEARIAAATQQKAE